MNPYYLDLMEVRRVVIMINSSGFKTQRLLILSITFVVILIVVGIYSGVYHSNHIEQTSISVCLNEDTRNIFEEQYEKKSFSKHYVYEESTAYNADLVFTSDINLIDTKQNYSVVAYSPLVICLKDTNDLNSSLKSKTKQGFLTCNDTKIRNTSSDEVNCDFKKVINAVLNGQDWSDLGGTDQKITIYCPISDTAEGKLFYEFLLITINDGKYPTSNMDEIKEIADQFLDSQNVIQTDVASKINKLGSSLEYGDMYILFESSLLSSANLSADICVTYPEVTVVKQLYLQYRNTEIEEGVSKQFDKRIPLEGSLSSRLIYKEFYRTKSHTSVYYSDQNGKYFNTQDGFNYYDLNN